MAWVGWVEEDEATGTVAEIYERAREKFTFVPDAVKIFSLRPEVAEAQEKMRGALLGGASTLGARRADMISAAVSGLNHCEYCATAHVGLLAKRGDLEESEAVALYKNWRKVDLPEADRAMIEFAEKLTFMPSEIKESDIQRLRDVGFTDVNIYDIVMVTAYRNFMNRVNDGLGVPVDRLRGRFGDTIVDAVLST